MNSDTIRKLLLLAIVCVLATFSSPTRGAALPLCVQGDEIQVCAGGAWIRCENGETIKACLDTSNEEEECWNLSCGGVPLGDKYCCGEN